MVQAPEGQKAGAGPRGPQAAQRAGGPRREQAPPAGTTSGTTPPVTAESKRPTHRGAGEGSQPHGASSKGGAQPPPAAGLQRRFRRWHCQACLGAGGPAGPGLQEKRSLRGERAVPGRTSSPKPPRSSGRRQEAEAPSDGSVTTKKCHLRGRAPGMWQAPWKARAPSFRIDRRNRTFFCDRNPNTECRSVPLKHQVFPRWVPHVPASPATRTLGRGAGLGTRRGPSQRACARTDGACWGCRGVPETGNRQPHFTPRGVLSASGSRRGPPSPGLPGTLLSAGHRTCRPDPVARWEAGPPHPPMSGTWSLRSRPRGAEERCVAGGAHAESRHGGTMRRLVARPAGRGQQKISSPSAGTSGPSPDGERPLFFFFFSFLSLGFANPNRRVEAAAAGAGLGPSAALLVWPAALSM